MLADKKKLVVVGVLGVVVLGVGVFEFTGGSSAPDPAKKPVSHRHSSPDAAAVTSGAATPTDASVKPTDKKPGSKDGDKAASAAPVIGEPDLQERDPFDGSKWITAERPAGSPNPAATPPSNPRPMRGAVAAVVPPMIPGTLNTIPSAGGSAQAPGQYAPVPAPQPRFEYGVSGVVAGDRPMAVFVDSKGNQRLIQLGGSLDGDTTVTSVSRGKVTVRWHGKNLTLNVGANNPTEKRSDEK